MKFTYVTTLGKEKKRKYNISYQSAQIKMIYKLYRLPCFMLELKGDDETSNKILVSPSPPTLLFSSYHYLHFLLQC